MRGTMLQTEAWTYETLAACDRKQLEEIMLTGTAPDPEELEGYIYCGWNHEWVGTLSGRKFKKGFRKREGKPFGFNEICDQTGAAPTGEWKVAMHDGRPRQVGFFRVGATADEPVQRLNKPYRHTGHFNYDVKKNTWLNSPFKVIRDFVVLPNPGDHSLMLCKAYFQLGFPWLTLFYCYFLLGHRQKIDFEPW
jgi:hypothetical protein